MADVRNTEIYTAGILHWLGENASQGIFTTDSALTIQFWNRWLTNATGLASEEVIGRPLFEVLPSLVERGLNSRYEDALNGQAYLLSHTLHKYLVLCAKPNGDAMPQTARIAPLMHDGNIVGTITMIEDVGERVSTERQLRDQIAVSEEARAQAEAASRAKDDFLATLSHEIRTPLSAVLGWVHLLKARDPDAATIKRAIEVIERNAQSQLTLISDMLDMARMSSGKTRLDLTDVDMAAVVASALDAVRTTADAKTVRLVTDIPRGVSIVSGDADRLLQIVWNLLSNAVKFTGAGGLVVVSLRSDLEGTHLTVADTGQGIDPKFLPQVFDRFKQADTSASRRHGGLGLGLALVKDLVAMHGGEVEVQSPGVGLGSTFSVHLPNRISGPRRAAPGNAAAPVESTLNGLRILIVEDDPDARDIARRSIAEAGGAVIVAGSAIEALSSLAATADVPHIIVSDIGLPGTDGYELLTAVRELPPERGGGVPAIAVTAYASKADSDRALAHGFIAHITKPYLPSTLVAAVRLAVDKARASTSL